MFKNLLLFVAFLCCFSILTAQNVFSPSDAIVTYNSSARAGSSTNPNQPPYFQMTKWVRTSRVSWNTSNFKCYIWNGMNFRMRFPNNYNAANATKYPVLIFYHGGGEIGSVYDNEDQLVWAAQLFEQRINNNEWNGFMIFPQQTAIGWNDYHFSRVNSILDTLQKYNNSDPDKVITMGLSAGAFGGLYHANLYPQRVASTIDASPPQASSLIAATSTSADISKWVHVPVWFANGGTDVNPDPFSSQAFFTGFRNGGGNIFQSYYVNDGHGTWTDMWNLKNTAGQYITDVYWAAAHKAQPLVYFQNQSFCSGGPIAARMGISAGFYAYEWQKDGVTIAGATGNEYTATQAGSYTVRFMRIQGGVWSARTPSPVVITTKACTLDTLFAEHFNTDNPYGSTTAYSSGNFTCQNGIATTSTDLFTKDATGVQGNRFLISFTASGSSCVYKAGDIVWSSANTIPVTPNTSYEYSFYVGSQNSTSPAQLAPTINGTALITSYVSVTGTGNASWKKFTYTWNSGTATSAKLGIINRSVVTNGNDFAIDEIAFKRPPAALVTACATNQAPVNASTITTNATATLTWGAVTNATSYDVYLWTGATVPTTPVANVSTNTYNATALTGSALYNWYVVPRNADGIATTTNCSTTNKTTFTTAAAPVAPSCVTNTSPANASTLTTASAATLSWPAATGAATSYDVYLWTGATVPTTPTTNVTATTYSATGLTAASQYSWYIVPKNAVGSATGCNSNATTFTTAVAAPLCVTNTSPADASTITTQTTATLTWPASANATSYDVYLWTGATAPTTATATVTAATYGATGLTAAATYNWYVVPKNATGSATGCATNNKTTFTTASPVQVPACVINTSPADALTITTQTTATLVWPAAATATSYDVYIWTGATVPTAATANLTATTYTATNLNAGTTYSWYIAPRNAGGAATTCAAGNKTSFTTAAAVIPIPVCAVNSAPVNGSTLTTQTTATLTWGAVATATSYDVYIWTGATTPTTATTNVTTTTYSASGLTAGATYNWFIIPKNISGGATGCDVSNKTSFTTAAIPVPACVTNTSPVNGSTITTQTTATLVWPAAATATSYDVYIWTGATVPTVVTANTTATTYSATNLNASTIYNWYVAPRNAGGAATTCGTSNVTTFTTATATIPIPACVTNTSPVNASTLTTQTTATLTWPAATNATSYDVYLWTGVTVPTTPTTNTASLTYSATGLTAGALYNWYIAPRNASGAATACATSNVTTFTTAAATVPVPACVTNTSPVNASTLTTQTTAILTWPAAANATSYDVYLWTGATVPTTPTTNTASLTYSATGLTAGALYNWYIAPRNASGAASTCGTSSVTTFTTAAGAAVPACVVNILPASGSVLLSQTSTNLTWPASPNATSYDVYLWAGTTVPTTPTTNVTALIYGASGLTAGTTYNWYIAPRNANGAATACASANKTTFTTAAATGGANQPPVSNAGIAATVILPASSAALDASASYDPDGTIIEYYWYQAQGPVTAVIGNNFSTLTTVSGLTTAGTYVFGLQVKDNNGVLAYSTKTVTVNPAPVAVPACTVNSAPANASTLTTQTTATLTWAALANATSYDVFIWTGATAPTTATANVTAASFSATGLIAGTLYNWYVVPKNAVGPATGCSTNKSTFTTAVAVPACVTNTSPANAATLTTQTSAVLAWPAAAGATSYDVYVWTGSIVPTTATTNTTALTYTVTNLSAGTLYNWYISPVNAGGTNATCKTTNTTTFTTAAGTVPLPACVTNTAPVNASTLTTQTTATLTWPASTNATSYDVYLWTGATVPTTPTTNTTLLTYSATGLTASTIYNWYIAPRNASGAATTCATANKTTFTTAAPIVTAPACVINTAPVSGTTILSQTSTNLTWPASPNATSYDVYLWTGATVPTTPTTNVTTLIYGASGLTAGTTYSWYVAPRNVNGVATTCASANKTTFTTAAATGGANQSPVSNAGSNVTITLPVSSVTLDGSASYDPNGSIIEYFWFQAQGPVTAVIGNNFSTITTLTGLTTAGTYVFGLQVKDNAGVLAYAFKTVVVNAAGAREADAIALQTATATKFVSSTQVVTVVAPSISPNPLSPGLFAKLQVSSNNGGTASVQVMSTTGNIVQGEQLNVVPGVNNLSLHTANLRPGLYFIHVGGNVNKTATIKLVVN